MNLLNLFRHPRELTDLSPDELEAKIAEEQCVLIDVRTPREYQSGHIGVARSYPLGHEAEIVRDYRPEQDLVLICRTGHRSQAAAAELLKQNFRKLSHLKGGMDTWKRAGKK